MKLEEILEQESEYFVATLIYNKLKNRYNYHNKKYHQNVSGEWKSLDSEYIEFRKDFRKEIGVVKQELQAFIDKIVKNIKEYEKNQENELESNSLKVKCGKFCEIVDKLKTVSYYNRVMSNCKELFYVSELP